MSEEYRAAAETATDPSPAVVPIDPAQLDRIDDSLHFGWSWHRHRFCYRRTAGIRALDAGCGTGLSTLGLARLNPGAASVVGIDLSPRALELAGERARVSGIEGIEFRTHDLAEPLPAAWGAFDFISCRHVLGGVEDPVRVLENLARALDPRGLLFATFPTRAGRQPARQMRRAVEAMATPEMGIGDRATIGLELFQALRPDHPIRHYDAGVGGPGPPGPERFIATYLEPYGRDFDLPEAIAIVERAGMRMLFAPTRWPWQAARVFTGQAVPDDLKTRVDALSPARMAALIDALDPVLHFDEYRIYACRAEFEPTLPSWPDDRQETPETIDRLIPHLSGLARPADPPPAAAASGGGKVRYLTVTGAVGELDSRSDLLLRAVDGRTPCGAIDQAVADQTGVAEQLQVRRQRWVELANSGFLLLESPDPRQNVDCRHLGAVLDRLDCACPRRWVRACDLHTYCTIGTVSAESETFPALRDALKRLGVERAIACAECADYTPEEV